MIKVSPASLQTFIDTPNCVLEDRVQYSTVHIPNVFKSSIVWVLFVRCTETFRSPCKIATYFGESRQSSGHEYNI